MGFYDKLEEEVTKTTTENGAPTFSTSLNKNLDMFSLGGASRRWNESEISTMFGNAFNEDRETAMRNIVHLRNIRHGGLGERRAFRASVDYLIKEDGYGQNVGRALTGLVSYLPQLGRWDDIFHIFNGTSSKELKQAVAQMIANQLQQDIKAVEDEEPISLLAKWAPSINTSSKDTKKSARELINYMFGEKGPQQEKVYRKTLSHLRKNLDVLEVKMSSNRWGEIDYNKVPSVASIKYRTAFHRNDGERYEQYLEGLESGETKVNASVTYPYQIVESYGEGGGWMDRMGDPDKLLEQAWKSLPDYIEGSDERAIVVADTSGSMTGTPMSVSVSLAIYSAERLKGEFAGKYITFSAEPTLNSIHLDESLHSKLEKVYDSEWGMNTDLMKTFRLILNTATKNNMTQDEVPNKIIVTSDMEFDDANGGYSGWGSGRGGQELTETTYLQAKREFTEAGYEIPDIIFWNVDAEGKSIPVRKDEVGTALVSGLTPTIFKTVLNGKILNPEQLMRDTLYQEKYDFVKDLL